jgi:hypothetical protein
MNYKLTAITFADVASAEKFIKENKKFWETVNGFTHKIVSSPLTTTITVVFAKSLNVLATILHKTKNIAKLKCYRAIFHGWFPQPPKNLNRLPLSMKDVKEFLREELGCLNPPPGMDKADWKTDLFMVATYMESQDFWSSALAVIEWIDKQEQKYVPV